MEDQVLQINLEWMQMYPLPRIIQPPLSMALHLLAIVG